MKKIKNPRPKEKDLLLRYFEEQEFVRVEEIRGTVLIFIFLFAFFTMPLTAIKASIVPYALLALISILHYGIIYKRVSAFVLKNTSMFNAFKHFQSIVNLTLITILVHLTGGMESYFTFVYIFEVIMAGFLLSWRESFWEASMGWMFYLLMLMLEKFGVITHISIWPGMGNMYTISQTIFMYTFRLMIMLYISSFIAGYLNAYILKNAEKMIKIMSYVSKISLGVNRVIINDYLTNFYSFNYFRLRLTEEILKARFFESELALVCFRIKNFEQFAEKYGMSVSNAISREISRALRYTFSKHDVPARISDGEFIALLVDAKEASVAHKIREIKDHIENMHMDEKRLYTESIILASGWVLFPEDAKDPDVLIEKARQALYIAERMNDDSIFRYKSELEKN